LAKRLPATSRSTRHRVLVIPTWLPQLPPGQALATVKLPLSLNWSQPGRVFRLSDRGDRARVYELVLREGAEEEILRYVDGTLLADLWDELVLPRVVRAAWSPLIEQILGPRSRSRGRCSGEALGGDE
jgi:hypothetical protein